MSYYEPPKPVKVISDDGGLYRIVEYSNGARAQQYYDVDEEIWLNECDEVGNFITIQEDEEEDV
jgi:hypothetical protein